MDVIGYQGAVLGLVLADEPVLHAVIDEKSRPAGADIQEPVRCLVQCIDMNRLDWKGDMSAGPPCPSSRYNPMPVPIHIHSGAFSSMAVMGPGTGYRRTVPSWGSKRLRLWQPLSIYILRNLFRCH